MNNLSLKIEQHPIEVQYFFFKGKILLAQDATEVSKAVEQKIAQGKTKFVFDLQDLTLVNSSGLNLFVKLFSAIRNKGGELVFCAISAGVKKVFHISKLDTIFNISVSQKEALNFLNAK